MEQRVVGLFCWPWGPDPAALRASRAPLDLYRYAVWFKANPRSREYMRNLFEERYPGGVFVDVAATPAWREPLAAAGTIVLLYPDAIGLGCGATERAVRGALAPGADLRVLNGRRRDFALDGGTRRALALRRLLERSMLAELLFIPVFLCVTPVLLAIDLLRGRR
jgi:hypothetical protein